MASWESFDFMQNHRVHDHEFRFGILDDIDDFLHGEQQVDGNDDPAVSDGAEIGIDEFRGIETAQYQPYLLPDSPTFFR
jgi:hypothetical protein